MPLAGSDAGNPFPASDDEIEAETTATTGASEAAAGPTAAAASAEPSTAAVEEAAAAAAEAAAFELYKDTHRPSHAGTVAFAPGWGLIAAPTGEALEAKLAADFAALGDTARNFLLAAVAAAAAEQGPVHESTTGPMPTDEALWAALGGAPAR